MINTDQFLRMQKSGENESESHEEKRESRRSQPTIFCNLDQHSDQNCHHHQSISDTVNKFEIKDVI